MDKEIILGQEEKYDATVEDCWSFQKVDDVVNGVSMRLSNMAGGFPFDFNGETWKCSEMLYLCGEFSHNTERHLAIQRELCSVNSGYASKRFIKAKYLKEVRQDFFEFRLQWMLFVVWQKCKGSEAFRELLQSIPSDALLIENTTTDTGGSANIWGCSNRELRKARAIMEKRAREKYWYLKPKKLERQIRMEINKVNDIGTFVGQNNMGKILMLCRDALNCGKAPRIDYTELQRHNVWLLGRKVDFSQYIG